MKKLKKRDLQLKLEGFYIKIDPFNEGEIRELLNLLINLGYTWEFESISIEEDVAFLKGVSGKNIELGDSHIYYSAYVKQGAKSTGWLFKKINKILGLS